MTSWGSTNRGGNLAPVAAPSPGGGGFADWQTAGSALSTADNLDIQAAIDAAALVQPGLTSSMAKVVMMSDITEDSDIVPPSGGLWIDTNGFKLTLGAFKIDQGINGSDKLVLPSPGEISWAHTTGFALYHCNTTSIFIAHQVTLRNLSTVNSMVTNTAAIQTKSVTYFAPNLGSSGFNLTADRFHSIDGLEIVGGGADCASVLSFPLGAVAEVNNIKIRGSFSTTLPVISVENGHVINGLLIDATTAIKLGLVRGTVMGVIVDSFPEVEMIVGSGSILSGVRVIKDLKLTLTGSSRISDVVANKVTLDMTSNENRLARVQVDVLSTIGDRNEFDNCELTEPAIPAGADNNGFVQCRFRTVEGTSLTINDLALNTRLLGCLYDTTPSLGTGGTTESSCVDLSGGGGP